MSDQVRENLSRLMAQKGLSVRQLAELAELDGRTIRGILNGSKKPHMRSLRRLAEGLDASVDEFFLHSTQLLYRHLDRKADPLVEEVMQTHQDLFAGWTVADFDAIHRRMDKGDVSTREGAVTVVRQINHKREMHDKLDVLLESSQAETIGGIMELLCRQVVAEKK